MSRKIAGIAPARTTVAAAGLLLARQDPPADLVDALAAPLPILVICELLGVPYQDRDRFRAWTRAAVDVRDRARSEQGLADLFGYGRHLVARKREQPGDDVISRMCASGEADEIAMLSMFLLFAGHETTVVAIGLGALLLLANPPQWQALRDDPGLIPTFGHGPRYCIGAPLARIELQAVFSQLTQRFPDMRLAVPADELTIDTGVLTGGLTRLRVTW
jgi:cytochrome P450